MSTKSGAKYSILKILLSEAIFREAMGTGVFVDREYRLEEAISEPLAYGRCPKPFFLL